MQLVGYADGFRGICSWWTVQLMTHAAHQRQLASLRLVECELDDTTNFEYTHGPRSRPGSSTHELRGRHNVRCSKTSSLDHQNCTRWPGAGRPGARKPGAEYGKQSEDRPRPRSWCKGICIPSFWSLAVAWAFGISMPGWRGRFLFLSTSSSTPLGTSDHHFESCWGSRP